MFRKPVILLAALAAALAVTVTANATPGGRAASTGVVFVTSQGLYYDTFVTNDPTTDAREVPADRERRDRIRPR